MKIRIKNVTGSSSNEWLLWELRKEAGVKEGNIFEGKFNPSNNAVDFSTGTNDCVAWLGETCEEVIEYKLVISRAGLATFPGTKN